MSSSNDSTKSEFDYHSVHLIPGLITIDQLIHDSSDIRYQQYLKDCETYTNHKEFVSIDGYICTLTRNCILGTWRGILTIPLSYATQCSTIQLQDRQVEKIECKESSTLTLRFECDEETDFIPSDYIILGSCPSFKLYRSYSYANTCLDSLLSQIEKYSTIIK